MKKRIVSFILSCILIITSVTNIPVINVAAAITVYSQTDSRWANHQYGYKNAAGTQKATISSGGCGILSYVNAVYYLNGKFIDPIYLADWSVNHGYRVNGVGTAHGLYKAFADSQGNTYGIEYAGSTSSYSTLAAHLQSGGVAIGAAPGHLMAVVDYDAASGKFLILDSYKSSNRYTYQTGYTWQTESSCKNTEKLKFSTFMMIKGRGNVVPTVLTIDTTYSQYTPITAYLAVNNTVYPCKEDCATSNGGEIWTTDVCKIIEVYTNGWCKISYPGTGDSMRTAYTPLSNFIPSTNLGFSQKTATIEMQTYSRADLSNSIGNISQGDVCYLVGAVGNATQSIYPTASGYKLGWSNSSNWNNVPLELDEKFSSYCPIKGYMKGMEDVPVFKSDFSTPTGGELWADDYSTINKIYKNGWCEVTYPSVVAAGGTATGYVPLSTFVHDTSASLVRYTANTQINVFTRSDMSNSPNWWISSGDTFYKICTSGGVSQVLYPIDAKYGGGYKIGWIYNSDLPVSAYPVNYDANGGSGAPSAQSKRYGESLTLSSAIPERNGYTFAGWSTSRDSALVEYTAGSSYTNNSAITLYAVWNPIKYEISYNMNGGFANVPTQTKACGTNISLSSVIPEKAYNVYFYVYENELENTSKVLKCEFLGWSTSGTAATAEYQPGDTFTTDANVTLYAVWSDPVLGVLETPVKEGHEFLGWYTEDGIGGMEVTKDSTINSDITVYARWKPIPIVSYTVSYDANGGTNAPVEQIKMENETLVITGHIPTRAGYTFKGWSTSDLGLNVTYKAGDTYTANESKVLYAVWEKNKEVINGSTPSFVISDVAANAGSKVTVDISIRNNPGITAFKFSIDYPTDVMRLVDVEYKTLFSSKASGSKSMTDPFVISWFSTLSKDEMDNGVIATLTFEMLEDVRSGNYEISLTYEENNVFNSAYNNIVFDIDNGGITVCDSVPGDVNRDTIVNMKDLVLLQQYLNDWNVSINEAAANVNGDATINMKDLVLLQQYLNEWDVDLTVQP